MDGPPPTPTKAWGENLHTIWDRMKELEDVSSQHRIQHEKLERRLSMEQELRTSESVRKRRASFGAGR